MSDFVESDHGKISPNSTGFCRNIQWYKKKHVQAKWNFEDSL